MRVGAPPQEAWRAAGVNCGADGVPTPKALVAAWDLGQVGGTLRGVGRGRMPDSSRGSGPTGGLHAYARAVHVVAGMSRELGSPLADVVSQIASSIRSHEEAQRARATAFAGPKMSARVMMALPLVAALLSALLGVRVWEIYVDGGFGTMSAVAGLGFLAAGVRWVGTILARAELAAVRQTRAGGGR
ncbi:hypothetical protein [Rarobacter incanus]|nr:hypothetical protein [Rarobacter incanus]